MAQFESKRREFETDGVRVVFVAAEKPDGVWKPGKYFEKHPISFPFLLDADRSVTKVYGLHHRFGHDAINIARPATLVIDRAAVVRYIYRGEGQHDRAAIEQVLEAAKKFKD